MGKDKYRIDFLSQDYVDQMKRRLRQSDELEVGAACGQTADWGLQRSYEMSEAAWVGLIDGVPACAFGVVRTSLLSSVGVPWLLATPEFEEQGLEIVRLSKTYSNLMRGKFRLLMNYVDARQEKSIRWLRWLGFTLEEATPYGLLQMPFHKFHMKGTV